MRAIATAAAAALLTGCTPTVLLEPGLTVSPYYAVYQLRGDISLQTDPGNGGPIQDTLPRHLDEFGQDHHENDVGIRANFGDGFAGLDVDYYQLGMKTRKPGVIPFPWGALQADDTVRMDAFMDELRIGYVEPVGTIDSTFRDEDLTIRFAAGGELIYRDMRLRAMTDDLSRHQNLDINGETLAAKGRVRAEWGDLSLDADLSIAPDLVLRGDWAGYNYDFETRINYAVPHRDVTFFAGYRYSALEADGFQGPLGFDAELRIDGFQFGMTITL